MDFLNLTPVKFWPYESMVVDRILQVEARFNSPESDKLTYSETLDELISKFKGAGIKCERDNKIVFQCMTGSGKAVYIGFYDNCMSVGLDMHTGYWNKR